MILGKMTDKVGVGGSSPLISTREIVCSGLFFYFLTPPCVAEQHAKWNFASGWHPVSLRIKLVWYKVGVGVRCATPCLRHIRESTHLYQKKKVKSRFLYAPTYSCL